MGGAERCLVELATRVDRSRFEPVAFCLAPRPTDDERSCVPALEAAGVRTFFLNARRYVHFPGLVRRLASLLREAEVFVLQSFLFHANLAGRLAARRAGVPVVISGIRVAEPRRWHLWADRWTHGSVDRYVCVSRAVADFTASTGGIPREKLVVIPNGIELARYPSPHRANLASLGMPPGRKTALFVGRLDVQKGVDWLLETAGLWMQRLPEWDLLLVGEGPLRPRLQRLATRHGIAQRVHFAGFRGDVPEILAATDLLVLPSRWEGMPNAVLEAMASGLPVVSTRAEGVAELLGPGAAEQTVSLGDTQALVERLVTIASQPEVSARLGRENRARAKRSFGLPAMVAAYQDLWESLLRAKRG